FDPAADEPDVLGFIVSNHLIREALFEEVRNLDNVSFFCDTAVSDLKTDADHGATVVLSDGRNLRSRLIVAADSRFSETRRMMGIAASMYDFGRVCVVCRVQNERPHHGVAYECFHYGRTLAVLPLSGNCSSVVITAPMDERAAILEMESEPFSRDLESRFGGRLGRMQLTSERFAYPLVGVHSNHFVATRFALIGDAAVGMHPVTAHGYNLGLGGAEILASEITRSAERGEDIGAAPLLSRYESKHMRKTIPMYRGTNEMVRFFTDDRGPLKVARQIALRLSNNFPPVKRAIRSMLTEKDTSGGLLPLFFPRPPFLSRPSLSIRSNRRHEFETD
ncbi:MAG: FAD-dependent monooxygenase, partial [Pseudomonadales bacterium]|nr:FAD-dependent monooxygenase [Pseudomonadales bacterium]